MTIQLAERQDLSALPRGRGRGPGGAPTGLAIRLGRCPVPGCGDHIDRTRLMCRGDWYRVPKPVRDRAWRTWRSGQEAKSPQHQDAVLRAIACARVGRLRGWKRELVRLRLLINPARALDLCNKPPP
jgi:hypothetical protein